MPFHPEGEQVDASGKFGIDLVHMDNQELTHMIYTYLSY